jgi:hypothetical protein
MELQTNVPIPQEETQQPEAPIEKTLKKIRAKKPKAVPTAAAGLIAALKFINVAQSKKGDIAQQHCYVSGHWVAASNGVLTVAHPIEEDLSACPQTAQFLEALGKCTTEELSITQLSAETIAVKSGAFKALVPCVRFEQVPITAPDANIAAIDDRIKEALKAVLPLVAETSDQAFKAAALLQANTAVGTDGEAIIEYWHGIDLPPNMLLPRIAATAIAKAAAPLVGFGYSGASATFYFANGAWIKTQLFNAPYPNYLGIFPPESDAQPVPESFFTAVKAIAKFSQDGKVYLNEGVVCSHSVETEASTYRLEALSNGMAFESKLLLKVEHAFQRAEFNKATNRAIFFGTNCRGVVMAVKFETKPEAYGEDDVPF